MSTKSTIVLSEKNEHWYNDYIEESITIEINRDHLLFEEEDCFVFEIKKGTSLHKELKKKGI